MTYRIPAEAFPPGDFLQEELEARGWNQTELAEIINRPPRLINEIVAGKRGVSPDTAMDFAAAFGTSAQYWLNLESAYQLFKAAHTGERGVRDNIISREAKLREAFPVKDLVKRGWVQGSENFEVLESRVLSFYGVKTVDDEPELMRAAKRNYADKVSQQQLAWLFRVKQMADAHKAPKYSKKRLRAALSELEALTTEPEEIRHVPRILAECGVRFVIVEPMKGSKICGVCFWIDNNKTPVIGMTLLHDRIDNFWFVLRHECEHVLRGDGKQMPVVDIKGEGGQLTSDADEKAEKEANLAAADFCVPLMEIENFIGRVDPMYSEKKVIGFANRVHRHPGLVVGQIHNRTGRYELLRKHLKKVREIVTSSALTDGYGYAAPIEI